MSPRARRVLRWTRRVALAVGVLVVVAIAAIVILVNTDYGRELVRAEVEARLAKTFVGGATVGSIEGSPFEELVIHDLVINDPSGRPASRAGSARAP